MSNEEKGVTRWQFYGLALKVGVVLVVGVGLFLLAREGDTAAIAILAGLATLALLGLGLVAAVTILDRQAQAEQRRFIANAKENMWFLEQQSRVMNLQLQAQGRQTATMMRQNDQLTRRLPELGQRLDVDALVWDLGADSEISGGGWSDER